MYLCIDYREILASFTILIELDNISDNNITNHGLYFIEEVLKEHSWYKLFKRSISRLAFEWKIYYHNHSFVESHS